MYRNTYVSLQFSFFYSSSMVAIDVMGLEFELDLAYLL